MTRRPASESLGVERIAYTREEGAAALGIDHGSFGRLIRTGVVPHLELPGSHVLIGKRALEQWLTEQCLAGVRAPRAAMPEDDMPPVRRLRRKAGAA